LTLNLFFSSRWRRGISAAEEGALAGGKEARETGFLQQGRINGGGIKATTFLEISA